MKKSFLLLPLAAVILTACSSNTPAPVVAASDSTELSPGVMQPVAGTGATSYGWQSDVQSTEMPSSMSSTVYQPTPQPLPQPLPQPTYQAPQPVTPVAAPKATAPKATKPAKKVPQDFTIPRDEKNAPIYSQIDKGFYEGDSYTVRKGDTMFLIAYISGKDVKEIAALNNMSEPYQLNVGQKLKLSNQTSTAQTTQQTAAAPAPVVQKPVEPQITYTQGANGTTYASDGNITGPVKAGVGSEDTPVRGGIVASAGTTPPTTGVVASAGTPRVQATTASSNVSAPVSSGINWQWPTQGRVVAGFSAAEGGNKGIDIAGSKGQPVYAAAAGRVVYAGNALRGYGNLIIIKHNDDFLSAYAHNDSISVSDQDQVSAGEKIGTMGNTGTNSTKLHFEIRYKGKSIDPTRYLPRR